MGSHNRFISEHRNDAKRPSVMVSNRKRSGVELAPRVCERFGGGHHLIVWGRDPVEQHGHGHVAQHVRRRPKPVEQPIDGQQNRDLSTGSRTAANIKGMVTKLPEGIPPAPTLATSVVNTITTWSMKRQLISQRLGHEEHRRGLVECGPVVVEVRADAGRQLARSPGNPQPLERSERDRDRRRCAGRAERARHNVKRALEEAKRRHPRYAPTSGTGTRRPGWTDRAPPRG